MKFDAELARDGSVDPVDKALYAALASFVDSDDRDSDPDPYSGDVPTRARLAECIGRSVDTVDRATRRLEDRGLLRVHRRRDPNNPRSHLPSVYELLDHERWDERAAARAEARRAARRGSRTDAARGSRTDAARGSRTDAARGSRTDAAVPLPSENVSLSEARADAREENAAEAAKRESVAAHEGVQTIAQAWTEGTGLPRVPSSETAIAHQAAELLGEGHNADHLARVARWMAGRGWRDLGFALTAKDAPKHASAPSKAAQAEQAEQCPKHPGTARRAGGECAGCWVDRTQADALTA